MSVWMAEITITDFSASSWAASARPLIFRWMQSRNFRWWQRSYRGIRPHRRRHHQRHPQVRHQRSARQSLLLPKARSPYGSYFRRQAVEGFPARAIRRHGGRTNSQGQSLLLHFVRRNSRKPDARQSERSDWSHALSGCSPTIAANEALINSNTDCQRLALINFIKNTRSQEKVAGKAPHQELCIPAEDRL